MFPFQIKTQTAQLDLLTEVTPLQKDTHATYGKIFKYKIEEISPLNAQLYCNNYKLHLHVLAIQSSHLQAVYIKYKKEIMYP
jgi:hypothetical protein